MTDNRRLWLLQDDLQIIAHSLYGMTFGVAPADRVDVSAGDVEELADRIEHVITAIHVMTGGKYYGEPIPHLGVYPNIDPIDAV